MRSWKKKSGASGAWSKQWIVDGSDILRISWYGKRLRVLTYISTSAGLISEPSSTAGSTGCFSTEGSVQPPKTRTT